MHAPLHTSGAETELTGVWSPHPERAAALARDFGVRAFRSFDELLESSEAVDFAVPPAVQAELAIEAALAGRALLLEKPLAAALGDATRLVETIDTAGVANLVILTKRYHARTREFLARTKALSSPVLAVTGRYVHGGFLASGFIDESERSGWRASLGVLYDLGPHLLDLADAAAGAIRSVSATGDPGEVILLATEHEGGARGQFVISGRVQTPIVLTDLDVYANEAQVSYTTRGLELTEAMTTVRAEFAAAVRSGSPVTVDARRALTTERVVDAAARSLAGERRIPLP
jgi:predicted dehydrogenase